MKELLTDSLRGGLKSPLMMGQVWTWALVWIGTIVTALIMQYTSMQRATLPAIALVIHALALLIGGFMTGKVAGKKGWYYGGIQGIIYALALMVIGFLAFDTGMTVNPLLFLLCAFGISAIGGILGVNTRR